MKALIVLVAIAPLTAFADDEPRPQELFLGDTAWLQDRAELQLTAKPAWRRERWAMAAAIEYGLTSRAQLSLEGTWTDGPHMDVVRELELGAQFAVLRSERWALALGGNATADITGSDVELGIAPRASVSFGTRTIGANLSAAVSLSDGIEPALAVAVFARIGRVIPIAEIAVEDSAAVVRGGLAVQLGSTQLAGALGYSADLGASLHAALTWEIDLAGGDDDDEAVP
jgi:hypothetical protein